MMNFKKIMITNKTLIQNRWIFYFVLCLTLLPYFILCYYATPAADDFGYGARAIGSGWLKSQITFYNTWTGRYTATFFQITASLLGNYVKTYPFYLFFLQVLNIVSLWCFFSALLKQKLFQKTGFWPAIFFTVVYINIIPSVVEGFYWFSAAFTYQFASSLAFILISLLIIKPPATKAIKTLHISGIIFTTIVSIGCSELVSSILISAIIIVTIINFKNASKYTRLCCVLSLAISLICFFIVISAPGNYQRALHFPQRHRLMLTIEMTSRQLSDYLITWSTEPLLYITILISIPYAKKTCGYRRIKPVSKTIITLTFFYITSVFLASIFIFFWSTGAPIFAGRILNFHLLLFMVGVFIIITLIVSNINIKNFKFRKCETFILGTTLFLLISLVQTSNFKTAISDLTIANKYKKQLEERYNILAQAKKRKTKKTVVPPINYPYHIKSITYYDISTNFTHPNNCQLATYFGIESVRRESAGEYNKRISQSKEYP